jgi:hypothetical protein
MNESDVGAVIVTFDAIETAPDGIVQLPFDPWTANVVTSPGPSGVARAPTVAGAGRVSTSRHGVIGTSTGLGSELIVARTTPRPPAPNVTASAAPTAAQRALLTTCDSIDGPYAPAVAGPLRSA